MEKQPCVYIMTNRRRGTLYVGVTASLLHRAWQHRTGMVQGFTRKYNLHRLVYFEFHATFSDAILREKALKRWRRAWKIELVESKNPQWEDLFGVLTE
jgi:putative endonuclease